MTGRRLRLLRTKSLGDEFRGWKRRDSTVSGMDLTIPAALHDHRVVEGEPGIFPDPVARVLRAVAGLFRRKPAPDEVQSPEPEPPAQSDPTDDKPL